MPRLQTVRITNPSKTQTLQLTSISGDSPDFHPSFFKSKVRWFIVSALYVASFPGSSALKREH